MMRPPPRSPLFPYTTLSDLGEVDDDLIGPLLADLGLAHAELVDAAPHDVDRSEEHTSELQSRLHLVCRLLLEKKKTKKRRLRRRQRTSHSPGSRSRCCLP